MCMIDDATEWRFLDVKIRRALKHHTCTECGRTIHRGEFYERTHGSCDWDYKTIDTWKTCEHCCAARVWLEKECGGWLYTSILDDLIQHESGLSSLDVGDNAARCRLLCWAMSHQWKGWTVEQVSQVAGYSTRLN